MIELISRQVMLAEVREYMERNVDPARARLLLSILETIPVEADDAKKDETIQMLQDGNVSLMRMIDEECEKTVMLELERDALLKYLTESRCVPCDICKHDVDGSGVMGCKRVREIKGPCFEWVGVKEEK